MAILGQVTLPDGEARLVQPSVQLYVGQEAFGNGVLHIFDRKLCWLSSNNDGTGFSVTYPSIVLHAISTDLSSFAREHLYVLVDGNKSERRRRRGPLFMTSEEAQHQQEVLMENEEMNGDVDHDDEDDDTERSIEVRLVPDNSSTLADLYHEVCKCQELNPEEDESFSEDEEDMEENPEEGGVERWFTAENVEESELSEEGLANLQRMLGGGSNFLNGHRDGHGDEEHDDEQME